MNQNILMYFEYYFNNIILVIFNLEFQTDQRNSIKTHKLVSYLIFHLKEQPPTLVR